MGTISVKIARVYHYSTEEIKSLFPAIDDDNKEKLHNAALSLAKHDFNQEWQDGEISPNTDDFCFTIKK